MKPEKTNTLFLHGQMEPPPDPVPLQAGPLTLLFGHGDLRHIRYQGREVLRRVYVAVRDRDWGTVLPELNNLKVEQTAREFHITFDVRCQDGEIDFSWHGDIHGTDDGAVRFAMDGEAQSDFWRNRIGFCVLHPAAECAGEPCEVEHTDGRLVQGQFPAQIAPHQPFLDMRAIRYTVSPGVTAEIRLTGDTFEMEDQRNWTDASFKTYCTPLAEPFPVQVRTGDRVRQEIGLKLSGVQAQPAAVPAGDRTVHLTLDPGAPVPLPKLGLCDTPHSQPLTSHEIDRLRALNLGHLRVDLWLEGANWPGVLARSAAHARALGCPLELAIHLGRDPETSLNELLTTLQTHQPALARCILYHVDEEAADQTWVTLARRILGPYDPAVPFGSGAITNFTELNRWHDAQARAGKPIQADFFAYAANPQVHAFDSLSLVENLAGLGYTAAGAQALGPGLPVSVGPVTFRPQPNTAVGGSLGATLPDSVDPRQLSLFGAAWGLGAVKYLAENGVHCATFFETTGWRGLLETEAGSPMPDLFPSTPGMVFPLYHVFADVGATAGGEVRRSRSSHPLRVVSLVLQKGALIRWMAANLTGKPVTACLEGLPEAVTLRVLDRVPLEQAAQSPGPGTATDAGRLHLELSPYAVVTLDNLQLKELK